MRIASLIQFTIPGAPTVYYGDEVGVTGDDDPDDRRTYPWADLGGTPDTSLLAHYTALAAARRDLPVLRNGDFKALLADDDDGIAAYGRKTGSQAAIVVVNRGGSAASVNVPVGGWLRDGVAFTRRYQVGTGGSASASSAAGVVAVTVPANGAILLASGSDRPDRSRGARPHPRRRGQRRARRVLERGRGRRVVRRVGQPGHGRRLRPRERVADHGRPRSPSPGLPNAQEAYVVVTANDAAGNAGARSNEVHGQPHYAIGWSNLQWPPSMTHTISTTDRTDTAYGQVWIDGVTSQPGATPGLRAQLGFGPDGSDPAGNAAWTWVDGAFNVDAGNNDEYQASMLPESVGTFDYAWRYSTTGGRDWVYADLDGSPNGYQPAQAGLADRRLVR